MISFWVVTTMEMSLFSCMCVWGGGDTHVGSDQKCVNVELRTVENVSALAIINVYLWQPCTGPEDARAEPVRLATSLLHRLGRGFLLSGAFFCLFRRKICEMARSERK